MKGVQEVQSRAFYNCKLKGELEIPNLTKVYGSNTLSSKYSFENAFDPTEENPIIIKAPATIPSYTFSKSNLKSAILSDNLVEVADYAFWNCDTLTSIEMESVQRIGNAAFAKTQLTGELSIPNAITIGRDAFWGCNLTGEIAIPNLTKVYGGSTSTSKYSFENAFEEDAEITIISPKIIPSHTFTKSNIKSAKISGDLVELAGYAFWNCDTLTSIEMESVQKIGDAAFAKTQLTGQISIPNAITIGRDAFWGCNLTGVKLRDVEEIGTQAFYGCKLTGEIAIPNLKKVYGGSTSTSKYSFENAFDEDAEITVISPKIIPSHTFSKSNLKSAKISSDLVEVADYAFWNCDTLTSIEMESVQRIGDAAFAKTQLTGKLSIPNAIIIGRDAFYDCNLTGVKLRDVEEIGTQAFYGCKLTGEIAIPNLKKVYGGSTSTSKYSFENAFDEDAEITVISPKIIPSHTFSKSNLKSAKISSDLVEVADYAFWNCDTLTSIEMESVQRIGDAAFAKTQLTGKLSIPNAIIIGRDAFYDCKLTGVELRDVEEIGTHAFYDCKLTGEIAIPNLKRVGGNSSSSSRYSFENAFDENADITVISPEILPSYTFAKSNFKSATFSDNLKVVKNHAFYSCSNLESIEILSAEKIAYRAFWKTTSLDEINLNDKIEFDLFWGWKVGDMLIPSDDRENPPSADAEPVYYSVFSDNTIVYIDRTREPNGRDAQIKGIDGDGNEYDNWGAEKAIYLGEPGYKPPTKPEPEKPEKPEPENPEKPSQSTTVGGGNGGAVIPQPTTKPDVTETQTEATTQTVTEDKIETTTGKVTEDKTETTTNNSNEGVIIGGNNNGNSGNNGSNGNNSAIVDTDRNNTNNNINNNTDINNIGLIGDNDILNPIIEDVDVIGDGELGESEVVLLNDIKEENIIAAKNMLNNSSKGLLTAKNNDLANVYNEEASKTKTDKPAFGFANSTMSWLIILLIILVLII
ncbi:MAG: leucine-rich repeat domain-containing protein, partial [Eubacteriales bacterium]|nr:leucine-rich repeat domain-containing protein [Eubacteriales bacterium]